VAWFGSHAVSKFAKNAQTFVGVTRPAREGASPPT
jgi:hypothetical protein